MSFAQEQLINTFFAPLPFSLSILPAKSSLQNDFKIMIMREQG